MTYTGKWTCSECGDTSDNEHDPCACDDTCTEHVETIARLRADLERVTRELSEARECLDLYRSGRFTAESVVLRIEREVAEAIASFVEYEGPRFGTDTAMADDIRSGSLCRGTWKPASGGAK